MPAGVRLLSSFWSNSRASITDSWRPESSNWACSASRLDSRSPVGTSSADSEPPWPGSSPKLNSPSLSLPTRVRRSPSALSRLAWAWSSPTRAAMALTSRWASSRAWARSSACWSSWACMRAISSRAAPLAPRAR